MKKFLLFFILTILVFGNTALADVDISDSGDLWDDWNSDQSFYGQDKSVSDEEFEETVTKLEEKKNKKLRKKNIPKGKEFRQSNETGVITEQGNKDNLPVVCIPAELQLDDGVLPIGHYQVKGIKDENGNVYIELYQAQYIMAKFPAASTNDDFGEETILFAKWIPEGTDKIKLVFGSLDLNAYTIVNLKK